MSGATEGWLATRAESLDAQIHRWDGTSWRVAMVGTSGRDPQFALFLCIDAVGSGYGWAAGADAGEALLAQWDGSTWATVENTLDPAVSDIDVLTADDGWFVGEGGAIGRWNGLSWNLVHGMRADENLRGLALLGETDGWAVGSNGRIMRCCTPPAIQLFLPTALRGACLLCEPPNGRLPTN